MSDARHALAETLRAIHLLIDEADLRPAEVLNVADLSIATGVPEETVSALLRGEDVVEVQLVGRVSQRFRLLRETRLRHDGKTHSIREIATAIGTSHQALTPIAKGTGKPGLETAVNIETFFGVPTGFLTKEAVPALNEALQLVLHNLKGAADPLSHFMTSHGLVTIAQRGGKTLTQRQRTAIASMLDVVLDEGAGR
ncbi:helix-turn-helix transcriptional regulator [Streptomyces sp. NPDC005408]|uniref:helix-turn-helix domain-containing protein n=1 Tax=Streptomyces sp. NPDC005408 TaxID=3155341 RepID=UPI0033A484B6